MEYQLIKENCAVCETVCEGSREQPIDLDLSLPDYCPDIERILKCRVCPGITSRNIAGDQLEIEGSALVSLYYLDAKKRAVRLCEHSLPFSCSFPLKGSSGEAVALVRTRTDYLNCRALSPRRVDLHGAFSVLVTVLAPGNREYGSRVEGEDIQQQSHFETVSRLCAMAQQQFSVTEVLDIGQGKGTPETILRSDLSVRTESIKALADKLMLNGEAVLRLLYVTDQESGSLDTMTFHIPFTQVLDAPGVSEQTRQQVILEVMNYDTSLKSEFDENSTLVTLDARISAAVIACEEMQAEMTDDVYSTDYELSVTTSQQRFPGEMLSVEKDFSVKEEVSTGENGITRLIDLWCDSISSLYSYDKGQMTVRGKVNCCMLAVDAQEVPYYLERSLDAELVQELPEGWSDPQTRGDLQLSGLSFRISGDNRIELKADLRFEGTVCEGKTVRCSTAVEGDEEHPRSKDKTAALTLYYADEGERLWDIARIYCTSVEAIRLENEMTEDVVSAGGLMLIPMS